MGATELVDYYDKYLYFDYADVIEHMLVEYSKDELIKLLCECEMLLQTNDSYIKKLNERGFKRLLNLITGIEKKCNCRLQNNFQILHRITLAIEKNILLRIEDLTDLLLKQRDEQEKENIYVRYCINSLMQKVIDHKKAIKELELMKWASFTIEDYSSYSDTRKVLQIVSDIYVITNGSCECEDSILKSALKKLALCDIKIPPVDFAQIIMQHSEYLPLYIKDGENYNIVQSDISSYGRIIYQVRDLLIDQNIQKLAVAKGETVDKLCLPLLKKSIEEREIDRDAAFAPDIVRQLLKDMEKWHSEQVHVQKIEEERKIEIAKWQEEQQKQQQEQAQREAEKQKRYSLLLVYPSNVIECSLDSYVENSIEPTNDYGIDQESMNCVKMQIMTSEPAIIVKSDGIDERDLGIKDSDIYTQLSFADFRFYQLYKIGELRTAEVKNFAIIDYYDSNLYVSYYHFDDTSKKFEKRERFEIKDNKLASTVIKNIEEKVGAPENEIAIYRIFDNKSPIKKRLEREEKILFVDKEWKKSLRSKEERESVFEDLYKFHQEFLNCQKRSNLM